MSSDWRSLNFHLSSSRKPIVAFRKKILNPKNARVQDLFAEVNEWHFWLGWCDPGDPYFKKIKIRISRQKLETKFNVHCTLSFPHQWKKVTGLCRVSYIIGTSNCSPGHINITGNYLGNLSMTQTSHKDPRNRWAATAGCLRNMFQQLLICLHQGYR